MRDVLNMSRRGQPTTRDIETVEKTDGSAPSVDLRGFQLGVNLEEVYQIFGEHQQTRLGGVPTGRFEVAERKFQAIRSWLIDFDISDDIISAFMQIEPSVHRYQNGPQKLSPREQTQINLQIGRALSSMMHVIRSKLPSPFGEQYDLGIFIARLCFCAHFIRVLTSQAATATRLYDVPGMTEIYGRELDRASRAFENLYSNIENNISVETACGTALSIPMRELVGSLRFVKYWPTSAADIERLSEAVLNAAGFVRNE